MAPAKIEQDEKGQVSAIWLKEMTVGAIDASGRPKPVPTGAPDQRISSDVVVVAIGQAIESEFLEKDGIPCSWGKVTAQDDLSIQGHPGIFAGGDCVTGPATAIKAIGAGKVAAFNIDMYLGGHGIVPEDEISIPAAIPGDLSPAGRVNLRERPASERIHDWKQFELNMDFQEALHEARRCLRCDHYGSGSIEGGRLARW